MESSIQIEQDWRQMLDSTRRESRTAVERSIDQFKTFLEEVDAEEKVVWQDNERKIFEEVAHKLEKTFKWQDAAVKWFELVDRNKKKTMVTL